MSGNTARRVEILPASGEAVLGPGNFFFLLNAAANVTVSFQRGGTTFGATDIGAGYLKRNVSEWNRATITGPAGTSVTFFYGNEDIAEDDTDFRGGITTIAGVAAFAEQPAATLVSTANAALATANSLDISANLSRRRISIHSDSINAGSVWVRDQAGTTDAGQELQPGQTIEVKGTYAIRVRNNSGVSVNLSTNEES